MKSRLQRPLLLLCLALCAGCTTSDVIMTGNARAETSADAIKFYLRAPAAYQSIGLVTASSNSTPIRSTNKKFALQELREKAAKLGANGLILTEANGSPGVTGTVIVPQGSSVGIATGGRGTMVEVQGEAIWVEKE